MQKAGKYTKALFWSIPALPLVLLLLAMIAIRSPAFERYADSPWTKGYPGLFLSSHQACDVLIYGDSVAMTGLDPGVVEAGTGLRTCNIAVPGDVLQALGTGPLDDYLRRNPQPRYLVFHVNMYRLSRAALGPSSSPRDHDLAHQRNIAFDVFIPVLRYEGLGRGYWDMLHSPDNFIGLMQYVYIDGIRSFWKREVVKQTPPVDDAEGSYIVIPEPAMQECDSLHVYDNLPAPERSTADYLRSSYAARADHVLVDVAPMPNCVSSLFTPIWRTQFQGAIDNTLQYWPNQFFVDNVGHLTRPGAIRVSDELADELKRLSRGGMNAAEVPPMVPK